MVHTEVGVKIMVFWNLTSCSLGDDTSLKMERADHFQTGDLSTKLHCVTSRKSVILYYMRLEQGSVGGFNVNLYRPVDFVRKLNFPIS
jgi:hypothetical protein